MADYDVDNKDVDIGSYPFFRLGKIGVSIVTRSTSKLKLQSVNRDLIRFYLSNICIRISFINLWLR